MSRNVRCTITLAALSACLVFGGGAAVAGLIVNADMESNSGSGSELEGWTKITSSYGAWEGVAHSGGWVMHAGAGYGAGGEFQDITTVAGAEYELTFWAVGFINGADIQQGKVQVGTPGSDDRDLELDNNAEYLDIVFDVPMHASPEDWTPFSFSFTPDGSTTRVTFENIYLGDGQSAINVDDVDVNLGGDPARTLTFDAVGQGNWGFTNPDPPHHSRWLEEGDPVGDIPDGATITVLDASNVHTVVVEADHAALSLTVDGGGVAIDNGQSLTVSGGASFAPGTSLAVGENATLLVGQSLNVGADIPLTLGANASLQVAGHSAIDSLATLGDATIDTGRDMTIATFGDGGLGGAARVLNKRGEGILALNNLSGSAVVAEVTTFRVEAGTLRSIGSNPLGGATAVELAGGTLSVGNELLANGDMERNSGNGSNLDGWTKIINSHGAWDGIAHSGAWVMHSGTGHEAGGEFQDIPTTVGQAYELSFWAAGFIDGADVQQGKVQVGTPGIDPADLELENNAEYVDATFDVPLHTGPDDWREFTYTFTSTTTTTRVTFENVFLGEGQSAINVDDAVVAVPGDDGSLDMAATAVTVSADSALHVDSPSATWGELAMQGGVLTTSGASGGISFAQTTIAPDAVGAGFDTQTRTNPGTIDANAGTIIKTGPADLILDQPGGNLDGATFDVQEGRLASYHGPNPLGSATLQLSGGEVLLSAKDGGGASVDYDNAVVVETAGNLTAGMGDAGAAGPVRVNLGSTPDRGITLREGANLTLGSTDQYALHIVGTVAGGGGISLDEGNVTLEQPAQVGSMRVAGGALTLGGGATADELFVTGGALSALGNLSVGTMEVTGGTLALDGNQVAISERLKLDDTTYRITEGDSFVATGDDLFGEMDVALAGGVLTVSVPGAAGGEMILNGDMELNGGSGGDIDDWTKITNSFGAWDGVAHSGSYVMHAGASYGAGGEFQDINTVVGQEYELTFWAVGFINGADLQQGTVQVGTPGDDDTVLELDNNAEYVDALIEVPMHATPEDWRQFTHTFTPTATTTRVTFENISLGDGQSAINVDDVSVHLALPAALDLPNTNFAATADSTLDLITLEDAVLGDLRVAPGVTLEIASAAANFEDVVAGDLATVQGALIVRGSLVPTDGGIGTLAVDGLLEMEDSAQYVCELTAEANDMLRATEDIYPGGALVLRAIDSLPPAGQPASQPWGDSTRTVTVMATLGAESAIIGEFASLPAAGEHLGRGAYLTSIDVSPANFDASLEADLGLFQAASGDTDGDRDVDNADLQLILGANSFNNGSGFDWTEGDFDGDTDVDNADLQLVLATGLFGTGGYAAAAPGMLEHGAVVVPEPSTLLLLASGAIGFVLLTIRKWPVAA